MVDSRVVQDTSATATFRDLGAGIANQSQGSNPGGSSINGGAHTNPSVGSGTGGGGAAPEVGRVVLGSSNVTHVNISPTAA